MMMACDVDEEYDNEYDDGEYTMMMRVISAIVFIFFWRGVP